MPAKCRNDSYTTKTARAFDERLQANALNHSKLVADPSSALFCYVLADKLDDSLNNANKTSQVVRPTNKVRNSQKESQIQRLELESSAKNRRITLLVIGVILLQDFGRLTADSWLYRQRKKARSIR